MPPSASDLWGWAKTNLRDPADPEFSVPTRTPSAPGEPMDPVFSVPTRAPSVPVLWMLTKPGDFGCPFGARARLDIGKKPAKSRR